MTLHPAYGDKDTFEWVKKEKDKTYSAFCTCSAFYGHKGIACDVVSAHSQAMAAYAGVWSLFGFIRYLGTKQPRISL